MPGITIRVDPGTAAAVALPPLTVSSGSSSPWITRKGIFTPRSPPVRSGEANTAATCRAVPSGQ
jgi:hypothetical protein